MKEKLIEHFNQFYRLFFRCGVTKKEYAYIGPEIRNLNHKIWKYVNLLLLLLSVILLSLVLFTDLTNFHPGFAYFCIIYSFIVTILFFTVIKPESPLSEILIYTTIAFVYAIGIIIDIEFSDKFAVSFIIMLILIPLLRVDRPFVTVAIMTVAALTYLHIIGLTKIKTGLILYTDIADVMLAGFIGIVMSIYNNFLRAREILLAKKSNEEQTNTIAEQRDELKIKNKELLQALDIATAASKAKTAFLFNMSHDIRTPMNAIIGFMDLAVKDIENKERVLDCIKKSKDSSEHLLSLINDILDMSRIESGKMELSETPNDITLVIDESIPMLKSLAEKKNIELNIDVSDIQNKYLYFDTLRLNQAIINIVSNAVKYTPNYGKVFYTVKQLQSSINGYAIINFEIRDTGIGMEKSFLPHIFEQFSREKTSTVSKLQGTGLGLAITKRIVDMMKGSINVESEVGVGTTFNVSIPFRIQAENKILTTSNSVNIEEISKKLINKKCLLVEDNELNREISSEILADVGLKVETAEDGSIAVNMVKEKGITYYDFILMDIQMPIMDGYTATKEIRNQFPDNHIPIIALSANAFEEDKKESLKAGMDDHQSKPIVISELLIAISKLLK